MALGGRALQATCTCVSACLPPAASSLSPFDKHFLAATSMLGLCSVKATPLALGMLTARPAPSSSTGWTKGPVNVSPETGSSGRRTGSRYS